MRDARSKLRSMRLYVLITERFCRRPWRETAEMVLTAGVDVIQLREDRMADGELLDRACVLRDLTTETGALLIINDRPDIALMSRADGVHLGQADLPPQDVRGLVGPHVSIGVSTHSMDQVREACELAVDYVAIGPIAPTTTKDYKRGSGLRLVQNVCARCALSDLPVVAIGGINRGNAAEIMDTGPTAVAVCSAVCSAENPLEAAHELRALVEEAVQRRSESDE